MFSTDNTKWYRLSDATRHAILQGYIISGSPVNKSDLNSVLHWRIFVKCGLPDGTSQTVKVDLMPGLDARTGVLAVYDVLYEVSATSVADVTEYAASGITVEYLLSLLEYNGRNRYTYDSTGSGCRFWCRTVLSDLERGRLIYNGAVYRFDVYIAAKNQENPVRFPLPTRQGTFY
ncbi:hypothetical protein DFH29DRAFT_901422 [Suillus ampliporus]|nr:hypothetical protein DFH29DRAFT_901422 [Suillus ampliporus]